MKKKMQKNVGIMLGFIMLAISLGGCASQSSAPQATLTESATGQTEEMISEEMTSEEMTPEESLKRYYEEYSITVSETFPLYMKSPEKKSEITLYFEDDRKDIPFLAVKDIPELREMQLREFCSDQGAEMEMETSGKVVKLTRENGASVSIDFENRRVHYDDYSGFNGLSSTATSLDVVEYSGVDDEGRPAYFKRGETSFVRKGKSIDLELDQYFIPAFMQDGEGYLPLQFVSDFFGGGYCYMLYNGEAVFCVNEVTTNEPGTMGELYYAVAPGERTPRLAQFAYNEFALVMDHIYGLKGVHDIDDVDKLLDGQVDLYDEIVGSDNLKAAEAFNSLMIGYLCDFHSSYGANSHYLGADTKLRRENVIINPAYISFIERYQRYLMAREEYYPDGIRPYEEVGNTAYITFDDFDADYDRDYYAEPVTEKDIEGGNDTIGLVIYAHSQITREGSPIENVVVDLTCNGGGFADAAAYILGWLIGDAQIHLVDTMTDAQASTVYRVDANCDRVFDEKDTLGDRNIYCLTSGYSFSCGNMVPAMLQNSGKAVMLGETSGGGSCVVFPMSLADGTQIQISGNMRLSTLKNGSYYDIDQGVTPDFRISKPEHIYDRKWLTDYINQLP